MEEKLFLEKIEDTEKLGEIIAKNIGKSCVIALKGELGTGKTSLTKAIVKNLGIKTNVTSPTFNLMNIYENDEIQLYHFDFYRLEDENELENIGFYEYSKLGIAIIEWADKFIDSLPLNYILVEIEYSENQKFRYVKISSVGKKYTEIIKKIQSQFQEEGSN